ncbi:hypothetical protein [Streptosporangium sp. G12]
MTAGRVHLLGQAALCFEQVGRFADAARCREGAGEPVAAAELYRRADDVAEAARCYQRAGLTGEAARCLLELGRPEDAAELLEQAGQLLEAGWTLVADARRSAQARRLLTQVRPTQPGARLRHRIAEALCAALEGRPQSLIDALLEVEEKLAEVNPASERARAERWAVQAADQIGRPDLAAQVFAAAYRCGQRGVVARWRAWGGQALGGMAGIPERDL